MQSLSIKSQKLDYLKVLHIVVFAMMMMSCMLNSSNARAATGVPHDYDPAAANDMHSDDLQSAVAFKMRPPRRLRGQRAEPGVCATSFTLNRQTHKTGESL